MSKSYAIVTVPYTKQKQVIMKKPEMTFEFISHKNTRRFGEWARQAWLLGLHEDGYLFSTLQRIWEAGDNLVGAPYLQVFDVIVARADGAIVGMIFHEYDTSTLDTYVIPSWRKRGVASQMVQALRDNVGDSKVLCGWRGKEGQGWDSYYARNFILYLDVPTPKELIEKHVGDKPAADRAHLKSRKLKMSSAYRKHKVGK